MQCTTCQGRCNLKCYIKLTVSWINHKADHVVERTALPDHLICGAEGKIAFQDQHPRVRGGGACTSEVGVGVVGVVGVMVGSEI